MTYTETLEQYKLFLVSNNAPQELQDAFNAFVVDFTQTKDAFHTAFPEPPPTNETPSV